MERQKFEDSFKDAFKGAEVEPSDAVWTNVELDLEKASGGEMKRKLLFFQLLAAASMVFAMGIGAVYFLSDNQVTTNQPLAQQLPLNQSSDAIDNGNALASSTENQNTSIDNSDTSVETVNAIEGKNNTSNRSSVDQTTNNNTVQAANFTPSLNTLPVRVNNSLVADNRSDSRRNTPASQNNDLITNRKPSSTLVEYQRPTIEKPVVEADPGLLLLARLEDEARMLNKDEEKETYTEKIWTSFGAGAGSYDPRASGNASPPPAIKTSIASDPAPKKSTSNPTPGSSYSIGMSFAGKLSKRVVLQGGLSYLSQNAEFTSSTSDGQKATLNEVAVNSDNTLVTSPYKVNNNLKYLSVPLQAGYIVLDRSFGIQLNGGVSTDLFLQNTLTPSEKKIEKSTQSAGSDSPYRTVNFSGLVGTEFSYKIGNHYRIALNPGLRYALNSIYKSEIDTEISPMTFDVSLRFRYIFK